MLQLDDRDRISNLTRDLIHCILKRLSVHDVARTSVLSKEWRHLWGMSSELVLDKFFFSQLTSNKEKHAYHSVFIRALEMIFLGHIGRIFSFNLYIPPDIDMCLVTRWIEHFLKKGIRFLELDNSENSACEIPSGLFDCLELINLTLDTWILNTPDKCRSFTNLIRLKLTKISFTADVSFGTQLRYLTLIDCIGIKHLGCQFANGNSLTNVILVVSEQIDWQWFECTKQLRYLVLIFNFPATFFMKKPFNLIRLLSDLPSIKSFSTSGATLQVWRPELGFAKEIKNLKDLKVYELGSYNFLQILKALYLIGYLPNLQRLAITLVDDKRFIIPTALTINLDSIDWKDFSLGQLHTVKIQGVVGSNYVFFILKLLLASSPSLKRMLVVCNSKATDPTERLKIKQELLHFPRRSRMAQIFFG